MLNLGIGVIIGIVIGHYFPGIWNWAVEKYKIVLAKAK